MVLLLVDQMEEVFTQTAYEEEQRSFLDAICAAGDDASGPVRVMLTLRDDFLGHLASATSSAKNILQDVVVLKSPSTESLRQVLTKPLEMVGFQYEDPTIVDSMLNAVGPEGGLPLLQFTARTLWDNRDVKAREIKKAHYMEIGGVQGALAQHAESVLKRFTSQELNVARTLFLRMVTPERTRRTRPRSALIEGLHEPGDRVLNHLTQSRLVSARRTEDMDEQDAVFEFAHESLLNEWPTLSRWLDESREEIVFLNEVEQAAALWDKRGRRTPELWTGDALRNAIGARSRATTPIPEVVQEFIEEGSKRDAQIRLRRRFWSISLPLILAVVALVFAFQKYEADYQRDAAQTQQEQAFLQQEQAVKAQALAEGQRVEALLENARGAQERQRPLEARAKLRMAVEQTSNIVPAMRGLWWQLIQDPLEWSQDLATVLYETAWAPNGDLIAVGTQNKTIYLFDSATKATKILRDPRDQVHGLAFSPESKLLVSGDSSGYLYVHDTSSGQLLHQWQGHKNRVSDVTYHPTSGAIASAGDDGFIRIWEPDTQKEIRSLPFHTQDIRFNPEGTLLAAGNKERAGLWKVNDWSPVLTGKKGPFGVRVAFYSEDNLLATGGVDGKVRLWSSLTGELLQVMGENAMPINALITSPGSSKLISCHATHLQVWNGKTGTGEGMFRLPSTLSAALSPDGKRVVSVGGDKHVRVWTVDRFDSASFERTHSALATVAFSPDGESLMSAGIDGTLGFWGVQSGALDGGFRDQPEGLRAIYSPDGKHMAWAGWAGSLHVHSLPSKEREFIVQGHLQAIVSLSFNAQSDAIVTASDDGHAKVWGLDGTLIADIDTRRGAVLNACFSPDGTQLATSSPTGISIWDLRTQKEIQYGVGPKGRAYSLDWSRDGKFIAFGTRSSKLWLWDLTKKKGPEEVNSHGKMNGVRFHPIEPWVGVASIDNTVRVLDFSGRVVGTYRGHQSEVNNVDFSPDGKLIASASDDGRVRTWVVETNEPFWKTVGLVGRPALVHTHRGWEDLKESADPVTTDSSSWHTATEQATFAVSSHNGVIACLLDKTSVLHVWNTREKKQDSTQPGVRQVIATNGGCLARHGERVTAYQEGKKPLDLTFEATAQLIGAGTEHLLIATQDTLLLFDMEGDKLGETPLTEGVTALTALEGLGKQDVLAMGYQDGVVELGPLHLEGLGGKNSLQDCPNSPVSILKAGPPGSIIAGFQDGTVGLWGLRDGTLIQKTRLHGALMHVILQDETLLAATDLGDTLKWDLGPFYTDQCTLLNEIWAHVPITWQRGQAARENPPPQHPCFSEVE
jgi:WD40 repeat protein